MQLSIVVPCYNEENNLKRGVLEEISKYLLKQDFRWEVIVVNDESTDSSETILQKKIKNLPNFSLITIKHGGKPAAVWAGIQRAKYSNILFADMDQSTPITELPKLLPWLKDDYSFVIGSRGHSRDGTTLVRKAMAFAFLNFRKTMLLSNINDTQCGFKIINTKLAKRIFPKLGVFNQTAQTGWRVSAFDVELLFLAQKMGYKIKEVEVVWKNEDTSNTKGSDLARFKKESKQMLTEIIRVKKNDLLGKYENI